MRYPSAWAPSFVASVDLPSACEAKPVATTLSPTAILKYATSLLSLLPNDIPPVNLGKFLVAYALKSTSGIFIPATASST